MTSQAATIQSPDLAVHAYAHARPPGDCDAMLDLRVSLDERAFLAVDLDRILTETLRAEIDDGLAALNDYGLADPYGERRLGPGVLAHFGLSEGVVTGAAGVNALLHALALLAGDAGVYVASDGYPDLPGWIRGRGGRCVGRDVSVDGLSHAAAVRRLRPALVLIDRPSLLGQDLTRDEFGELCQVAAPSLVVVDESYANYLSPQVSLAPLTARFDNLLVLRGLSKAYWLGGLRVGYAISAAPAAKRLRTALCPLTASSLALRIARAVLAQGDLTDPLRAVTAKVQAQAREALQTFGGAGLVKMAPNLPYAFLDADNDNAVQALARRGVAIKRHTFWSPAENRVVSRPRMALPLKQDRLDRLFQALAHPLEGALS